MHSRRLQYYILIHALYTLEYICIDLLSRIACCSSTQYFNIATIANNFAHNNIRYSDGPENVMMMVKFSFPTSDGSINGVL